VPTYWRTAVWRALTLLDTGLSLNEVARRMRQCQSVLPVAQCPRRGGAEACGFAFRPDARSSLGKTQRRQVGEVALKDPWHTATEPTCDHGANRQNSCGDVRSPLSPRPCGSVDAQLAMGVPRNPSGVRCKRDEEKIARLETKGLAPGKKNAARLGAHIVFADESGFLLIPRWARTWAREGKNPCIVIARAAGIKVSVISGISLSPQRHHLGLYYLLSLTISAQDEVCVFLRALLRHLRGPVIVLLDNSSTHEGKPLQKLLRQHPRLTISIFPPMPRTSTRMKESVLASATRQQLPQGCRGVDRRRHAFDRRHSRFAEKLRGCILQSELPPFLR